MQVRTSALRATLATFAALLASLGFASVAHGARGLELGFADPLYRSADRDIWLDRTVEAGAGTVKLFVAWNGIAKSEPLQPQDPTDPAYSFEALDESVGTAQSRGLDVLLAVQAAPSWAEGGGRPKSAPAGTWKPDPAKLGDFMTALATRYSGSFTNAKGVRLPLVDSFQIWNEPNLATYLSPQYEGTSPVGAEHYKKMLNASYDAVHSVRADDQVVTAGLSPYGDAPGGNRTRPLSFLREVLCLKNGSLEPEENCADPARFDVLAAHAINTSGPPKQSAINPDDASSGDLKAIARTLRAAEEHRTIGGGSSHPLWVTEFWWETDPPSNRGFSVATQARFIQETMYLAWRAGFSMAIQLRLRDAPPSDNVSSRPACGLYFINGQPKPSARAFGFPFVAQPGQGKKIKLWGKAPLAGKVVIQRKFQGRWRKVSSLKAGNSRVFSGTTKIRGKPKLRARTSGATSFAWKVE